MLNACVSLRLRQGLLSPEAGRAYRDFILAPGSTLDGEQLLRAFLGRDPSPDAFLRSKGIVPA